MSWLKRLGVWLFQPAEDRRETMPAPLHLAVNNLMVHEQDRLKRGLFDEALELRIQRRKLEIAMLGGKEDDLVQVLHRHDLWVSSRR